LGANECPVFDARHVAGMRAGKVTARAFFGVELDKGAALHHQIAESLIFRIRTVTPVNVLRLAESGHFLNPGEKLVI
jgi:hypothetical protein